MFLFEHVGYGVKRKLYYERMNIGLTRPVLFLLFSGCEKAELEGSADCGGRGATYGHLVASGATTTKLDHKTPRV